MKREWLAIAVLTATAACSAGPLPRSAAAFVGTKGISLHEWFTWPRQVAPDRYATPLFQAPKGELTRAEAQGLRNLGFDFVRLTVEPGVFMATTGADKVQAFAALVAGVDRLHAAHLSVIVDLHPNGHYRPVGSVLGTGAESLQRGVADPLAKRFASSAAALAGALDRRYGSGRAIAFELLNEPSLPCVSDSWSKQQAALYRTVRAAAPRLTLVLTGACWSGIDGLTALHASDYADPNTLYTFHFYDEHRFTHQGVPGEEPQASIGGLPYPWYTRASEDVRRETKAHLATRGADASNASIAFDYIDQYLAQHTDRDAIAAKLQRVADWAKANGITPDRILMGEFGVNAVAGAYLGARDPDRLRWLRDVRELAEAQGFRWALWAYRSDYGMRLELDRGTEEMDRGELDALGLKPKG